MKESHTSNHDTPGKELQGDDFPSPPCSLHVGGEVPGVGDAACTAHPDAVGCWASLRVCWWPHQNSLSPITRSSPMEPHRISCCIRFSKVVHLDMQNSVLQNTIAHWLLVLLKSAWSCDCGSCSSPSTFEKHVLVYFSQCRLRLFETLAPLPRWYTHKQCSSLNFTTFYVGLSAFENFAHQTFTNHPHGAQLRKFSLCSCHLEIGQRLRNF